MSLQFQVLISLSLCGIIFAQQWDGYNNQGYGNGYGDYGNYGGLGLGNLGYNGNYGSLGGGSGYGNTNALGGGTAQFGNILTNNFAKSYSSPWGGHGFAQNSGSGSGQGVNIFGAATSNSGYNPAYTSGRR